MRILNLPLVRKEGFVDACYGISPKFRIEPGRRYVEVLAAAIGGHPQVYRDKISGTVHTRDGHLPRLSDFLPQHEQAWLDAMSMYISDICGIM